jgi:hypothetical protein
MSCESAVSFRGFSPQESAEICGVLTTTFPAEHWLGITFAKSYEDVGLCGRYVPELGQVTLFDRPDCPDVRHVLAHELGHHIKEKYVDRDLMSRASFGAMIIGYPSVVLTQASQHGRLPSMRSLLKSTANTQWIQMVFRRRPQQHTTG